MELVAAFLSIVLIGGLVQWQINVSAFKEHMDRMGKILYDRQISLNVKEQQQQNTINYINELMNSNKKTLKENQIALYGIKESSLFLYDHYNRISDLITNNIDLAENDEDIEAMTQEVDHVEHSIAEVTAFFITCFKMTPEQYREQKLKEKITFKQVMKRQNGENFESEFSLN
jgi:4-hydroxyphenylpyruvate dioxygenase-like putative hemolysin